MIKLWSELPAARTKELIADVATLLWVVFWANIVWRLFRIPVELRGGRPYGARRRREHDPGRT